MICCFCNELIGLWETDMDLTVRKKAVKLNHSFTLGDGRYGSDFKLMLRIKFMSIPCKIAVKCMSQNTYDNSIFV